MPPTQTHYIDELNAVRKVSRAELKRRLARIQDVWHRRSRTEPGPTRRLPRIKKTKKPKEIQERRPTTTKPPLTTSSEVKRIRPPRRISEPVLRTQPNLNWRKSPLIPVIDTRTSVMRKTGNSYCSQALFTPKPEESLPASLSPKMIHELIRRVPSRPAPETKSFKLRLIEGMRKRKAINTFKPTNLRPPFESDYRMFKYMDVK